MKEGWHIDHLGNLGTFQRGGNFLKSDFVETGFPCIHYGQIHMHLGVATYKHSTCIQEQLALTKARIAHTGDLIIAITSEDVEGSCKSTAWLGDYDIAIGAHAAIYTHSLNPKYVSYFFCSPIFNKEKEAYTHGFKVIEIRPADIAKICIPYPSLAEQQRIVDILDAEFEKIDALKANAEKNLQNAKDLFQAALSAMYSGHSDWKWETIGSLFKTGSGGTPNKAHKDYYVGGNIPWLRSGEVNKKYIDNTEMYITQKGLDNSSAKWFPVDTVLVAMYGATAGQVGILKVSSTTNQAVCGIFPDEDFIPEFVYYSLLRAQKELVSKATGNAQPNISQIKVKDTLIPDIPSEEQRVIVSSLDTLDSAIKRQQDNYFQTLSLCDDLKQALLRKAFNGEL